MNNWSYICGWGIGVAVAVAVFSAPPVFAHRSGCHTLHSCSSDTNTYTCGDLGYPCDGSTSAKDVALKDIVVPLVVEATFKGVFERTPSELESAYWKKRWRSDKGGLTKIRQAMRWHKSVGSFGPSQAKVATVNIVSRINALFRAVYNGRNPTESENRYWLGRLSDKPTEDALQGAMAWHRQNGVVH